MRLQQAAARSAAMPLPLTACVATRSNSPFPRGPAGVGRFDLLVTWPFPWPAAPHGRAGCRLPSLRGRAGALPTGRCRRL